MCCTGREDVEDGLLSKLAAFGSPQLFFIKFADMALYFTLCYATLYFSSSVFKQIAHARQSLP